VQQQHLERAQAGETTDVLDRVAVQPQLPQLDQRVDPLDHADLVEREV